MPLYFPQIYEEETSRSMTATFLGLNRKLRIADGEFCDMQNLTSDHAPVLAVRKQRGIPTFENAVKPTCITTRATGVAGTYQPVWLDGTILNIGADRQIDLQPLGLEDDGTERELVNMGAYIIVSPDLIYVNTVNDEDMGIIEESETYQGGYGEGQLSKMLITVCDSQGNPPTYAQEEWPEIQSEGATWHKTGSEPAFYKYDASAKEWYKATSYLKVTLKKRSKHEYEDGTEIWYDQTAAITFPSKLNVGDQIRFKSLFTLPAMSGIKTIHGITSLIESDEEGSDYLSSFWYEGITNAAAGITIDLTSYEVTLERAIPIMDYICEAGNRLWGCRYGNNLEGNFVNEIYCSARGDFFHWFLGAADNDDAPVTFSIGTDGAWTGAVNYDGYPTFFKERGMHRISGSGASTYSIYETPCMGVARGAHKSLAVVGRNLFYKSVSSVMMFDGSSPVSVSDALGRLQNFTGAVGGACGPKYYLSLWRNTGSSVTDKNLFVLDTDKGLWYREDATECESMAPAGDNMYFVEVIRKNETVSHKIKMVEPTEEMTKNEIESPMIHWYAETGIIGLETPDEKYLSKIAIRLNLDAGSNVRIFVEYDSTGGWKQIAGTETQVMKTVPIQFIPVRCDHLRIRMEGEGGCKIFSITKTFESAEDM